MAGYTYSNLTDDIRNYTEVSSTVLTQAIINRFIENAEFRINQELPMDADRFVQEGNLVINKNTINSRDGEGIVKAIKQLVSKRLVNVYKYDGLQITVNSINELKEARSNIGKYITFS